MEIKNKENKNNKLRVIYWSRKIEPDMLSKAFEKYKIIYSSFPSKKRMFGVREALFEFSDEKTG